MRFRSTQNIFSDLGEVFDPNWMDSDKVILPPNPDWDYSREMQIEDVDIWEVIWEAGGAWGVYAAWCPYAEFYMLCIGFNQINTKLEVETFYGQGAQKKLLERTKELNIPLNVHKNWVDDEYLWLFQKPEVELKTFLL
jgi:hypothetical protein